MISVRVAAASGCAPKWVLIVIGDAVKGDEVHRRAARIGHSAQRALGGEGRQPIRHFALDPQWSRLAPAVEHPRREVPALGGDLADHREVLGEREGLADERVRPALRDRSAAALARAR